MTESEIDALIFVCPYHGRIPLESVTTMKTCGKCMESLSIDAGSSTILLREPYQRHDPRWNYDCARCKFGWSCGPQCSCVLEIKERIPKRRQIEVKKAQEMFNKKKS